jgi:hypothetical protein
VQVDASIEWREPSIENILDQRLTGKNLAGRFEKRAQ